jgi:hypothetical protein
MRATVRYLFACTSKHHYSTSGYYAIQFFRPCPSPIRAFNFEDVPHSSKLHLAIHPVPTAGGNTGRQQWSLA